MRFLVVKNWAKFQHQSDRRLPWIKLFTALLEPTRDPAYALLSDTAKVLLHHIWLMARVFNNRIPEDWLTREKLNLHTRVSLDPLLDSGFVSFQTDSSSLACARRASNFSTSQSLSEEEEESEGKPADNGAFDSLWRDYPRKRGRDKAEGHFRAQISTRSDLAAITSAIANYRREVEILAVEERFILHGSTFFNGRWKDYIDGVWKAPSTSANTAQKPIRTAPRKTE